MDSKNKIYLPIPAVVNQEDIIKRIKNLSYLIWERHGKPEGMQNWFWEEAEREFYKNWFDCDYKKL